MAKRLLDRQVDLIHYLTSGGAIFGDGGPPRAGALRGIDPALLRLEARFSHEKRMEKIAGVFFRTFELLGEQRAALVREFVDACPPAHIGRLENARQFQDFLCARRNRAPALPAYLCDVARCEFALAAARAMRDERAPDAQERAATHGRIRRAAGAVLLRSAFDIRPLFEDTGRATDVERRDTLVAVARPLGAGEPQIFELAPAVFQLVSALDDWTERAALAGSADADALIGEFSRAGLIESER